MPSSSTSSNTYSTSSVLSQLKRTLQEFEELKSIRQKKIQEQERIQREINRWKRDQHGNIVHVDPEKFYHSFGYFSNPHTRKPVVKLTPYQVKVWKTILENRESFFLKSNRVGVSSIVGTATFQNCFFPSGAGMDKLIISQKFDIAKDHLYNLRGWITDSKRFSRFLITKADKEYQFRDEASKSTSISIKNPFNPTGRPSRIIAVGNSPGSALSRAYVNWVWISDITIAQQDYSRLLDAAFTRLMMSRGKMIIETMPSGPSGPIYELWQKIIRGKTRFAHQKITCYDAVKYGVLSQEDLNEERIRLGHRFPLFYECEFVSTEGNVYESEMINHAVNNATELDPLDNFQIKLTPKYMGIDPGLGSSKFGITVTQSRPVDKIVEVIYAEEFSTSDIDRMAKKIIRLFHFFGIQRIYADASNAGLIDKLKKDLSDKEHDKSNKKFTDFKEIWRNGEIVNPISFKRYAMEMIQHSQRILTKGRIAIDGQKFHELISQIRSATIVNEATNPKLDKDTYGTMDLFDSWILSLMGFTFKS